MCCVAIAAWQKGSAWQFNVLIITLNVLIWSQIIGLLSFSIVRCVRNSAFSPIRAKGLWNLWMTIKYEISGQQLKMVLQAREETKVAIVTHFWFCDNKVEAGNNFNFHSLCIWARLLCRSWCSFVWEAVAGWGESKEAPQPLHSVTILTIVTLSSPPHPRKLQWLCIEPGRVWDSRRVWEPLAQI